MRAELASGTDGTTVAATTIGRLANAGRGSKLESFVVLRERVIAVIGHAIVSFPPSTWLFLDITLISVGLYVGYSIFPPPVEMLITPHIVLWQAIAIFAFVVAMAGLIFGVHERETVMSRSRIVTRLLLTTLAAIVLAYAIIHVIMYATISRRITGFALSLYLTSGSLIRLMAWWAVHRLRRRLLVVGPKTLFESFQHACDNDGLPEYTLAGFVSATPEPDDAGNGRSYLGVVDGQISKLKEAGITDIVVGTELARDKNVMDWVVRCLQTGCRVTDEATFYEKATGQILVDQMTPHWFLFADLKVHCDKQATITRLFDIVVTLAVFLVTVPLWPFIAVAIKLCDGGPVFYSQDRVGQNGRVFKLYKFRTMKPNAENGKSIWASPNDPRVTPVGRFLRKARLDELPQLYNVMMGQMSVVGPRPERPDIVRELSKALPYYAERHLVKPGITGWAQISFRYGSCIEDAKRKLQFDLYYLKHMSLELDMIILLRTLGTFLRGAC